MSVLSWYADNTDQTDDHRFTQIRNELKKINKSVVICLICVISVP